MRQTTRPHCNPRFIRGFTLIELMITLVVVGILTALVYPSFLDSIRKGRRSDAYAAINAIQQAQERFRANNASFSSSITNAVDADPRGLAMAANSGNGLYALSLSNVSAVNYTVLATAVAGKSQAKDTACLVIGARSVGGNVSLGSGAAAASMDWNDAKRCWNK
jgi:type IV pilus assembly protein PilE